MAIEDEAGPEEVVRLDDAGKVFWRDDVLATLVMSAFEEVCPAELITPDDVTIWLDGGSAEERTVLPGKVALEEVGVPTELES